MDGIFDPVLRVHLLLFMPFMNSVITNPPPPENEKKVMQGQGAVSVFPYFVHSESTEIAPEKEKIVYSKRGKGRIFHSGFLINISNIRGA